MTGCAGFASRRAGPVSQPPRNLDCHARAAGPWDVDHTLLNAGRGLSGQLYGLVFADLFGRELAQVAPMAGRTDRAIIAETLTMAGIADPARHVAAFIAGLTQQAPAFGERVRRHGHVLPGAAEALKLLGSPAALDGTLGGCTSPC